MTNIDTTPKVTHHLSTDMELTTTEPARMVVSAAPTALAGVISAETFAATVNGQITAESELELSGARLYVIDTEPGTVHIAYRAELAASDVPHAVNPGDNIVFTRPSRYCPSDHLSGFATTEFGLQSPAFERATAITQWIAERINYVAGSSTVHDTAEDTLLTGEGTCRDFAHLGIALCRAIEIPARFVSVWAPGLSPMEFHAVFEVLDDNRWCCLDATRMAPRQSLVRIATGRDAADAAFLTVFGGVAELTSIAVIAAYEGTLPTDNGEIVYLS